ncbi:MAG TPA: alpha/beta hydrolase [Acidimicrobiales bacterium]|nr:alpha/beta hydrolase [Acidimicrobiales bacterium]
MALIERDGAKLYYEDEGKETGRAPLVLVHGWTCFHGHLAPQAAHFSPGRRVVSVDLRGHGQSDVTPPFTIEQFADDVAWLIGELGLDRPVVVGHSMGGNIVVQVAATRPGLVRGVVAIDSPFSERGGLDEVTGPLRDALSGPGYEATMTSMISAMFGPHDDPAVAKEIRAVMSTAPQQVAVDAITSVMGWAGADAVRACTVPVLTIAAEAGGFGDVSSLKATAPMLMTAQTVGAGHFNQVFVADQVNAMIDRFLSIIA